MCSSDLYRWASITRASLHHGALKHQAKHFFYAAGWKKFEFAWDLLIRARQLNHVTPMLEGVLSRVTSSTTETTPGRPTHESQLVEIQP